MASAFDLDQFVAECCAARDGDPSHRLVRKVVARAVSDPAVVLKGLGEPKRSEVQRLYHSENLTILKVIWAPGMTVTPHDHRMWAVIGIYAGGEDNTFLRRAAPGLAVSGTKRLEACSQLLLSYVQRVIPIHVIGFAEKRAEYPIGGLSERRARGSAHGRACKPATGLQSIQEFGNQA